MIRSNQIFFRLLRRRGRWWTLLVKLNLLSSLCRGLLLFIFFMMYIIGAYSFFVYNVVTMSRNMFFLVIFCCANAMVVLSCHILLGSPFFYFFYPCLYLICDYCSQYLSVLLSLCWFLRPVIIYNAFRFTSTHSNWIDAYILGLRKTFRLFWKQQLSTTWRWVYQNVQWWSVHNWQCKQKEKDKAEVKFNENSVNINSRWSFKKGHKSVNSELGVGTRVWSLLSTKTRNKSSSKSLIFTFSKVPQKLASFSPGQREKRGPFLHVHQHQRGRGGSVITVYHCGLSLNFILETSWVALYSVVCVCVSECVC